jgi:hypothetical protein
LVGWLVGWLHTLFTNVTAGCGLDRTPYSLPVSVDCRIFLQSSSLYTNKLNVLLANQNYHVVNTVNNHVNRI